ncbi:MAG: hypothetical protein WC586_09385 [Methanoregula sp.]
MEWIRTKHERFEALRPFDPGTVAKLLEENGCCIPVIPMLSRETPIPLSELSKTSPYSQEYLSLAAQKDFLMPPGPATHDMQPGGHWTITA